MKDLYDHIISVICSPAGQNVEEARLFTKTRDPEIIYAKQLCIYFAKELKLGSLRAIGNKFKMRQHGTVLHSIKTINNYIDTDPVKRSQIQKYQSAFQKVKKLHTNFISINITIDELSKTILHLQIKLSDLTRDAQNIEFALSTDIFPANDTIEEWIRINHPDLQPDQRKVIFTAMTAIRDNKLYTNGK